MDRGCVLDGVMAVNGNKAESRSAAAAWPRLSSGEVPGTSLPLFARESCSQTVWEGATADHKALQKKEINLLCIIIYNAAWRAGEVSTCAFLCHLGQLFWSPMASYALLPLLQQICHLLIGISSFQGFLSLSRLLLHPPACLFLVKNIHW